jgi:hypothetical protein
VNLHSKIRFVAMAAIASILFLSGRALADDVEEYDDDDPSALTDFHATLDPVGSWVDDPTYGTVWVPSASAVGADFIPYQTGGHWSYGEDYVWVSDWPWGWAPFHYGRWALIDGRGWSWIPGRRYAPSWVSWQTGLPGFGGWVGWSPLAPAWGWRDGVAFRFGFAVTPHYGYCERDHLFDANFRDHVVRGPGAEFVASGMRPWTPGGRDGYRGPPPEKIGIPADHVPHGNNDPGNKKAEDFGRPSSSGPLGGHPPAPTTHHGKDPAAPDHNPKGPDQPKGGKGDHGGGDHGEHKHK